MDLIPHPLYTSLPSISVNLGYISRENIWLHQLTLVLGFLTWGLWAPKMICSILCLGTYVSYSGEKIHIFHRILKKILRTAKLLKSLGKIFFFTSRPANLRSCIFNGGILGSSRKIVWGMGKGQVSSPPISSTATQHIHCSLESETCSILEHFTFRNFVCCVPWENVPSSVRLSPFLTDPVVCSQNLWTLPFCYKLLLS